MISEGQFKMSSRVLFSSKMSSCFFSELCIEKYFFGDVVKLSRSEDSEREYWEGGRQLGCSECLLGRRSAAHASVGPTSTKNEVVTRNKVGATMLRER